MASSDSESSASGSSSGSGSGSRQSSASRSPSPPTVNTSSQRLAASANTSNTSSYIPDSGYTPASLSAGLTLSALKEAQSSGKQLWTIKVPDGVHPSLLQGLVFDLPESPTSKKNKKKSGNSSLGSLKISTRDEETGEKKSKDVYHLYCHSGSSQSADAKNSKPGQSGKKAKKDGEKSQLVNSADDDEAGQFGAHMTGLKAYVAVDGGRPGQISLAPMAISQHLEFVLAPPEVELKAEEQSTGFQSLFVSEDKKATTAPKRRELKGYFAPTGSLYDEELEVGGAKAVSSESSTAKKRKKDEIVDPAEVSSSPSSKKSKVKEEKRSSKDKKDKKRKSG